MFRKFRHILLACAVLAATGTHWLVLQSAAWTTMFATNLRTASLTEAVERTFTTQCGLCKEITRGKQAEKKSAALAGFHQLEFVNESNALLLMSPRLADLQLRADAPPRSRSIEPPLRPPRLSA